MTAPTRRRRRRATDEAPPATSAILRSVEGRRPPGRRTIRAAVRLGAAVLTAITLAPRTGVGQDVPASLATVESHAGGIQLVLDFLTEQPLERASEVDLASARRLLSLALALSNREGRHAQAMYALRDAERIAGSLANRELRLDDYLELTAVYAKDPQEAFDRAVVWSPSTIRRVAAFVALKPRVSTDAVPWAAITAKTVLRAMMLHTEVGMFAAPVPEQSPHNKMADPRPREDPRAAHLAAVRQLRPLVTGAEADEFLRRWCLAVGAHLHGEMRVAEAIEHFDGCLATYPADPQLLLAAASLEEFLASPAFEPPRRPQGQIPPDVEQQLALVASRASGAGACAESLYRRAIEAQPDLAEAHLRLGRVLWASGRADAALAEFALATRGDIRVRYLAGLFEGDVQESSGSHAAAADAYRRAATLCALCPTPGIALSHLLLRGGDATSAILALQPAIAPVPDRPISDPWWDYPLGSWRLRNRTLQWLREAVQ